MREGGSGSGGTQGPATHGGQPGRKHREPERAESPSGSKTCDLFRWGGESLCNHDTPHNIM